MRYIGYNEAQILICSYRPQWIICRYCLVFKKSNTVEVFMTNYMCTYRDAELNKRLNRHVDQSVFEKPCNEVLFVDHT